NLIAATAKGKRLFAPLLFEGSLDSSVFNGSLGFSVVLKYCEINRLHEFFISVGAENGYI
ncbi:MAG: hypothetical protein ABGX43_06450, partial [Nitrospinaceae bacterium]